METPLDLVLDPNAVDPGEVAGLVWEYNRERVENLVSMSVSIHRVATTREEASNRWMLTTMVEVR